MRINITPRQCACFLKVAETGSFSEAARQLSISQPALSRTISQIESALKVHLFDRTTRTVGLTPAGGALRPIALRLVQEFEGSFGELGRFIAGQSGQVRIAALPSIAAVLLPRAISRFRELHPDVDFKILDGLSETVLKTVADGWAEVGLTNEPRSLEKVTYRRLYEDELGLVCRRDDPLAQKEALPWSIFTARPFIGMSLASSVRSMTDAAFLKAGIAVPLLYECEFLGTTGNLVAAGLGITALPRTTMPLTGSSELVWRRLKSPAIRRSLGVVVRRGRSLAPATDQFLAVLVQEAKLI